MDGGRDELPFLKLFGWFCSRSGPALLSDSPVSSSWKGQCPVFATSCCRRRHLRSTAWPSFSREAGKRRAGKPSGRQDHLHPPPLPRKPFLHNDGPCLGGFWLGDHTWQPPGLTHKGDPPPPYPTLHRPPFVSFCLRFTTKSQSRRCRQVATTHGRTSKNFYLLRDRPT